MDTVRNIFELQKEHDSLYIDYNRYKDDEKYKMEVITRRVLDLNDQIIKLLNTFNWKQSVDKGKINRSNFNSQMIDVFKYVIGIMIMEGIDPHKCMKLFTDKTFYGLINERHKIKFKKTDKVVIFDIDGVIADYESSYEDFLCSELGVNKSDLNERDKYKFYERFNISKEHEEKLNNKFMDENGFRNIQPYFEIKKLVNDIYNDITVKVVLLTSRPVNNYSWVKVDTVLWLSDYNIMYNKLLFDKDKCDAIINNILPAKPLFVVEDRDKHAVEISHLGIPVLLVDRNYNRNFDETKYKNIKRCNSVEQLYKEISEIIKNEKEKQNGN